MNKYIAFLYLWVILSISTIPQGLINASDLIDDDCIATFDDFAYRGPLIDRDLMRPRRAPSWEIEATIPVEHVSGLSLLPVGTRQVDNQTEIWIRQSQISFQATTDDAFVIYTVETQTWENVSAEVENNLYIRDIWIDSNGQVWGKPIWMTEGFYQRNPSLMRFDETQRRFISVDGIPRIGIMNEYFHNNSALVAIDGQDNIWLFNIDGSHIYRYDPVQDTSEMISSLDTLSVNDVFTKDVMAAIASSEYIYFQRYASPLAPPIFQIKPDTLYRISIETGEVESLESPNEWPIYSRLHIDQEDRFWLGTIGYQDHDGSWQLVHPEPEAFFDVVDNGGFSYVWGPASFNFQSTDGKMWFNRYLDTGGFAEGLAWYDPVTDEGCLITTHYTTIVEDANQKLWIVIDNVLYTHQYVD